MDKLSNRPLLDNRVDMELYLPRDGATEALDRAVRNGWNAVVTGPRGSGKTTILRAWAYDNRRDRAKVVAKDQVDRLADINHVFVPAAGATDAPALLTAVITAAIRAGRGQTTKTPDLTPDAIWRRMDRERGTTPVSTSLIEVLRDLIASEDTLFTVILDDVDPRAGHQLFGVMRDELWTVPAQWIVAVDTADAAGLLRPPADAFFEATVALQPLTVGEATSFLARRLKDPFTLQLREAFPDGIYPRDLLELARHGDTATEDGFHAAGSALTRRDRAIAQLGQPAAALARAMSDLGPVSPSDERLLIQLRWTRPRASQVLKQLADAGLVSFTTAPASGGPGRPARLYQLVTPEDYREPQVAAAR